MSDDSITRFAQKHRLKAAATLVQVISNESASDNARIAAAEKILHYSDGRPAPAKRITPTDVVSLTADQREQLGEALVGVMPHDERQHFLHLLLVCYEAEMPGDFKAKMVEAVEEALAQQANPPRFQRGASALLAAPEHSTLACAGVCGNSTLAARSDARAIADGEQHSGSHTPSETPALDATLSEDFASQQNRSQDRLRHAETHERHTEAISGHADAAETPQASKAGMRDAPPSEPVNRFSGLPVNPLLPHLDEPSGSAADGGKITSEIVRRSAMRDPVNWR